MRENRTPTEGTSAMKQLARKLAALFTPRENELLALEARMGGVWWAQ